MFPLLHTFECRGGIFLERQTCVKQVKVKQRAGRLLAEPVCVQKVETRKRSFGYYFLQFDKLARNLAVVGGLALVLIAVRNSEQPEAQSVFGVLQESVGMQWNENIGKLTFVNSILPAEIREVWQETPGISLFSPVQGEIVHAWSQEEPYLLLNSVDGDIRAAAGGEVMAVAHGVNEEKILRIRHWDGTESVYGNLKQSYVDVGAEIHAGEIIGEVLELQPLAFEMRMNGKSVDVTHGLKPFAE